MKNGFKKSERNSSNAKKANTILSYFTKSVTSEKNIESVGKSSNEHEDNEEQHSASNSGTMMDESQNKIDVNDRLRIDVEASSQSHIATSDSSGHIDLEPSKSESRSAILPPKIEAADESGLVASCVMGNSSNVESSTSLEKSEERNKDPERSWRKRKLVETSGTEVKHSDPKKHRSSNHPEESSTRSKALERTSRSLKKSNHINETKDETRTSENSETKTKAKNANSNSSHPQRTTRRSKETAKVSATNKEDQVPGELKKKYVPRVPTEKTVRFETARILKAYLMKHYPSKLMPDRDTFTKTCKEMHRTIMSKKIIGMGILLLYHSLFFVSQTGQRKNAIFLSQINLESRNTSKNISFGIEVVRSSRITK